MCWGVHVLGCACVGVCMCVSVHVCDLCECASREKLIEWQVGQMVR